MTEILTSAQMRAIEAAAIDSGSVSGLDLMERAGRGVVDSVHAEWPRLAEVAPGRVVVLCGPGNNGGDGFVIARLLHQSGWRVDLYNHGDPARLPPDAHTNYARWAVLGQTGALLDPACGVPGGFGQDAPDLIVDALFGTGLGRSLEGGIAQALTDIENWKERHFAYPPTVAVDIPSGLSADSGRVLGRALHCDLTVTFHRAKLGHYLDAGPEHCGKVVVVDIGLPGLGRLPPLPHEEVRLAAPEPWRLRKRGGHKFDHGHALVLAGGAGRGGAGRLAARAALRIGAGLVTLGCPPAALSENAARLDAVMLTPIRDAAALSDRLADRRIRALCLGPGLGLDARAGALVAAALTTPDPAPKPQRRALVLDADALTLIARQSGLRAALHGDCIVTPHDGEFARLLPDLATRSDLSKVDKARAAAQSLGCVVLLKGPDTVIAAPDGLCALSPAAYDRAAPWLATAGAGDVLAGFITGLLARGFDPFGAACNAAWLHVECARAFGPGLIAEDLPESLPDVFRALGH